MKKNNFSGYLVFISIVSFIATFFFIVQNSYDNLMEPINSAKESVIIKPIDPNLDLSIVDEIEKRNYYTEEIHVSPTPSIAQKP